MGSYVSIWATGVTNIQGLDGQMATAAQDFHCCAIVTAGSLEVLRPGYAGAAPGMVAGVVQINFQVTAPGVATGQEFASRLTDSKTSDQFLSMQRHKPIPAACLR
jgi:uncharacterized protein (TIGR03437 family)